MCIRDRVSVVLIFGGVNQSPLLPEHLAREGLAHGRVIHAAARARFHLRFHLVVGNQPEHSAGTAEPERAFFHHRVQIFLHHLLRLLLQMCIRDRYTVMELLPSTLSMALSMFMENRTAAPVSSRQETVSYTHL